MATTILMRQRNGALVPVDKGGREIVDKLGTGTVLVEIRKPRNPAHHRKFMALMALIYENQSKYSSLEEMLDAIKVMLGHYQVMILGDGREVYIPRSISFAAMDQLEFEKFYDRVINLVCERILPRISRADLVREIEELVK